MNLYKYHNKPEQLVMYDKLNHLCEYMQALKQCNDLSSITLKGITLDSFVRNYNGIIDNDNMYCILNTVMSMILLPHTTADYADNYESDYTIGTTLQKITPVAYQLPILFKYKHVIGHAHINIINGTIDIVCTQKPHKTYRVPNSSCVGMCHEELAIFVDGIAEELE
jgi:hypothetical protein